MGRRELSWEEAFLARINIDGDCWEWEGPKNAQGYGCFSVKGTPYKAHREMYRLFYGDPGDFMVCHTCDNPACCNPEHLWLGTQAQNQADRWNKGRSGRVGRPRGIAGTPALSSQEIVEMIAEYKSGKITQQALALKYGISIPTVNRYVKRFWDLVPGTKWGK